MFYAVQFDDQTFLTTVDDVIALYPSVNDALDSVCLFGGRVVPMKVV